MRKQPVRTIHGLADVYDLLRVGIVKDIEARARESGKGFFRYERFKATPRDPHPARLHGFSGCIQRRMARSTRRVIFLVRLQFPSA